jgi:hypothetical protein
MELATLDGTIKQFISVLWHEATDTIVPVYQTQSGIFTDKKDPQNKQEYIYWSFIMDDKVQMLRMMNIPPTSGNPIVDWAYSFDKPTTAEATDKFRR